MAFDNTINPVASVKKEKAREKMLDDKKCLAKTMSPLIATNMHINSYMLGIMLHQTPYIKNFDIKTAKLQDRCTYFSPK